MLIYLGLGFGPRKQFSTILKKVLQKYCLNALNITEV